MIIKIVKLILASSSVCCGGEYPIITNNFGINLPTRTENDAEVYSVPDSLKPREYILIKNVLYDLSVAGFLVDSDNSVGDGWGKDFTIPASQSYLAHNFSPRNFLEGSFDSGAQTFLWTRPKFVLPTLNVAPGVTNLHPNVTTEDRDGDRIGNFWAVETLPSVIRSQEEGGFTKINNQEVWNAQKQYHFVLSPVSVITLLGDQDLSPDEILQRDLYSPNTALIRGRFELGGGLVCGREENNEYTLYRLPAYQNTGNAAIDVFNDDERLIWDNVKSNEDSLDALTNLRPDLLRHNTGITENRIFVRMQEFSIKVDEAGVSKALRDWYILAPFFDPATGQYRTSLQASDFQAGGNFDPNDSGFDPNEFVKTLVPYVLPADYWNRPESGTN